MSVYSNHDPEAVAAVNGDLWVSPEAAALLDAIQDEPARMPEPEDLPEPVGSPARTLCPVEALARYEAAYLTFIGYVESVAKDLQCGMNAREAAEALLARAEQQMALHRAWTAAKWGN